MNKKDEALLIAAKGFLIIRFGGDLTPNEAKIFSDLCCLALPMKYRFSKEELLRIEKFALENAGLDGPVCTVDHIWNDFASTREGKVRS